MKMRREVHQFNRLDHRPQRNAKNKAEPTHTLYFYTLFSPTQLKYGDWVYINNKMAGGGRQESSKGFAEDWGEWARTQCCRSQSKPTTPSAEASLAYGRQACALVVSTMLGIWQICGGKGEYGDGSELQDLEGRRSKVTAELRQAMNSGSSKRAAMKQDLEQWNVKEKVTERLERSR
jgi:hypothetical protein